MEEIWKPIPGYLERYEVSNVGRVRTLPYTIICVVNGKERRTPREGKIHSKCINKKGYSYVCIRDDWGIIQTPRVHQLVLSAFVGPRPFDKAVVNHINGIKDDNRVANLEWITQAGNVRHSIETGTFCSSVLNWENLIKLDLSLVREIKGWLEWGLTIKFVAEVYGLKESRVADISCRKSWRDA